MKSWRFWSGLWCIVALGMFCASIGPWNGWFGFGVFFALSVFCEAVADVLGAINQERKFSFTLRSAERGAAEGAADRSVSP